MSKFLKRILLAYLLVIPAFMVVVMVVAYPIALSIVRSFTQKGTGAFTLEHYVYFFTNKIQINNMLATLYVTIVTVVLVTVFSYFLALYMRFSQGVIRKIVGTLYLIPRFIPGMVAVYAMITIIRDSGLLNRLSHLFGYDFKPGLMFNLNGVITMNVWFNIPFATMIIVSSLSGIPDSIIEGARDVGASKFHVFRSMILPLSVKDAFIAATFVFMGNIGSFTTPYLLGPNNPKLLGIALYQQFSTYMDYEKAAALSMNMFLICSISAVVYIYTNMKEKDWEKSET